MASSDIRQAFFGDDCEEFTSALMGIPTQGKKRVPGLPKRRPGYNMRKPVSEEQLVVLFNNSKYNNIE